MARQALFFLCFLGGKCILDRDLYLRCSRPLTTLTDVLLRCGVVVSRSRGLHLAWISLFDLRWWI